MPKVMLVEDDNNLREIYQARLQAEGYEIVSAKDGEEALVIAKAEKPDLIIADVMMPKISGFEMLDILRNTNELKAVKVIMLTALGQSEDQQRAKSLGADRYLVKSQVTLEDIVKAAQELLGDASSKPAGPAGPSPDAGAPASPSATPDAPAPPDTALPAPTEPTQPTAIPVTEPPPDDAAKDDAKDAADDAGKDEAKDAAKDAAKDDAKDAADKAAEDDADEAAVAAAKDAQSTSQEEANANSRIEDFVAGATEEATLPAGTSTDAPSTDAPADKAAADVVSADSTATDKAADDKLVADAAQTLIDSTKDNDKAASIDAPTVVAPDADTATVSTPSVIEPETPAEETPAEETPAVKDEEPEEGTSSNVPIAHKKVITPLNNKPKKDIKSLLAAEEAKEDTTDPGDRPSGQAAGTPSIPPDSPVSPGSIAL